MSEWWRERVIYQIYPRSFLDTTGNGIGDLNGITQKLPYLHELGIGAIWISPFFKSPNVDGGYDVADYKAVDPLFGTDDDFKKLLQKAHEEDIKVIVDLVLNHTSEQHEWFKEARSSKDSPKHDWYLWSDTKEPPNNWLSIFTNTSAWWWNEQTREWYLGQFTKEQPEVNWRSPGLKRAMFDVLRFWLEAGVDGFRLDVANYYLKDEALRDNPRAITHPVFLMQHHVHDRNHPDAVQIFREMRQICAEYEGDRALIGEIDDKNPRTAALFQGQNDALHISFNFNFLWQKFSAEAFRDAARNHYNFIYQLSPENQANFTLSNHDQVRAATKHAKNDQRVVKLLATMLLTLRGTPTMYYGEEIGMPQQVIKKEQRMDPVATARFPMCLGYRDGCRTPMQWNGETSCGFTTGQPWLPLGDSSINVKSQETEENSILKFYKLLIKIRQSYKELRVEDIAIVDLPGNNDVFYYIRGCKHKMHVYLNFGKETKLQTVPGDIILQNEAEAGKLGEFGVLIISEK